MKAAAPFGWCIDGFHGRCIVTTASGYTCHCDCHDTPNPELPDPTSVSC